MQGYEMSRYVPPIGPLKGRLAPPGDKSITHRGILLGALAEGEASRLRGWIDCGDCRRTVACLRDMGVRFEHEGADLIVHGKGLGGLKPPAGILDAGNSGTTFRLLAGMLAGQHFDSVITGDASLKARPMARIHEPLDRMGARVEYLEREGFAPLRFQAAALKGIRYRMPVASAQVKSALLLAGLFAEGSMTVEEDVKTRDHTERLLKAMGADIQRDGGAVRMERAGRLEPLDLHVPGDMSSAAFFIALALMIPGSELTICRVGLNPGRMGFVHAVRRMGGSVEILNEERCGPEPCGDLRVRGSDLTGIEVSVRDVPSVIDELPLIALLATAARGSTRVRGAGELRFKESDRIRGTVRAVSDLGGRIEELDDGFRVTGPQTLEGGKGSSLGDHRTAMLLAVGGAASRKGVVIDGDEAVDLSYPAFFEELRRCSESSG